MKIVAAVVMVALTACTVQATTARDAVTPEAATRARVVSVTDGDTVVLAGTGVGAVHGANGGRKSRMIGVDTPELARGRECYAERARDFTTRVLVGTTVRVTFDVDKTDRYGRALVYLWTADGKLFNAELLRAGYAQQLTVPPNVRYVELFSGAARDARAAGRGLWSACD